MPTLKEVKAAEPRMKAAQEALKAYAERLQSSRRTETCTVAA